MAENTGEPEIIAGTVTRRIYFSPDTCYTVLRVQSPAYSSPVVCVGHVPPHLADALLPDTQVEMSGHWKTTKYGRQFHFEKISPAGEDEYSFFIRLIKGLGPKLVERIKRTFSRTELISLLEHDPQKLLDVPGIGPKKLEQILRSWREAKKFRSLYALFERTGAADRVSVSLIVKIYKHFEKRKLDPVIAIERNPYVLTEIRGIGFKTADKIALALGFPANDRRRVVAGAFYVLSKNAEEIGHTFLTEDQFREAILQELYTDEETAEFAGEIRDYLDELMSSPPENLVSDGERIGLGRLYLMESSIREKIPLMAQTALPRMPELSDTEMDRLISSFERRQGFTLTQGQRQFLKEVLSFRRRVFGLVGYAGTGKTTVLKALLEILVQKTSLFRPHEVVCCAFTGMAARRLREVTGFPFCHTIHSLLEYRNGAFQRGPDNPLDQRVVILDEASMVNLPLFFSLLSALRGDALFVLVGDPAQLPPIGAGNVFSDLVSTGLLPHVKLTEIKRQSPDSVITLVANEVREGIFPEEYLYDEWADFAWVEVRGENLWRARNRGASKKELDEMRHRNNERIREALLSRVRSLVQRGFSEWEVQVLSPMRIGLLGTTSLNLALREIFNPPDAAKPEVEIRGLKLRLGDKIINLENRDLPALSYRLYEQLQVGDMPLESLCEPRRILNGQLGRFIAYLPETEQIVARMVDVEDYVVFFDLDDLGRKIDLAYCLTVHKAQGSQYPYVLIPLTTSHWHMLNNQWLYTALTRAYRFCWLIGDRRAFKRAATNTETVRRQTWLSLA